MVELALTSAAPTKNDQPMDWLPLKRTDSLHRLITCPKPSSVRIRSGMLIVPCSMGTLAGSPPAALIYSSGRGVTLKEGRNLLYRESHPTMHSSGEPLEVARAGAQILRAPVSIIGRKRSKPWWIIWCSHPGSVRIPHSAPPMEGESQRRALGKLRLPLGEVG